MSWTWRRCEKGAFGKLENPAQYCRVLIEMEFVTGMSPLVFFLAYCKAGARLNVGAGGVDIIEIIS